MFFDTVFRHVALAVIFISLVHADLRHIIQSPKVTDWGDWGEFDRCPEGSFVTGVQLKVESSAGWKDDTGLNGIKFFCSQLGTEVNPEEPFTEIISSSIGRFGRWMSVFQCSKTKKTSAIVGFQLRSEDHKGGLDDTAANNLRVFCYDFSEESEKEPLFIEGDGTNWGDWSDSQFCRKGYAICGIQTQVDHNSRNKAGYDDTSLNNINAECCEIKLDSESESIEIPSDDRPNPVESAIHLHRDINNAAVPATPLSFQETLNTNYADEFKSFPKVSSTQSSTSSADPELELEINEKSGVTNGDFTPFMFQSSNATTDNYFIMPIMPNHTKLSEELSRIADLEFNPPQITDATLVPPSDNNKTQNNDMVSNVSFSMVEPILPPEVVRYLESESNDEDLSDLHVITGSIKRLNESADVKESEMTKDQDHLVSSVSPLNKGMISKLVYFTLFYLTFLFL